MPNRSREKGLRGEREVRSVLRAAGVEHQWFSYWDQRLHGGCDILAGRWAIEVKRSKKGHFLSAWLRKCQEDAKVLDACPVVVYRRDAKPGEKAAALWRARTLDYDEPLDAWIAQELREGRLQRTHADTLPDHEKPGNARFGAN